MAPSGSALEPPNAAATRSALGDLDLEPTRAVRHYPGLGPRKPCHLARLGPQATTAQAASSLRPHGRGPFGIKPRPVVNHTQLAAPDMAALVG